jgi:hypothetical protein
MTALAWLAATIAALAFIFVIASMLFFRDRTEHDDAPKEPSP